MNIEQMLRDAIERKTAWHVGCFHGTGEELIKKAYQDSEKSGRECEKVVRYVESILADEQKEQME